MLKQHKLKTITYCLLFSLVGMSDASLGAALPGLTCMARTSEEKATLVLFFHELGVLLMAVFSGFLNRKLPANQVLAVVSLLVPTSFILVTQCRSLVSMICIFTLMGTMEGCLEYFCNMQMISLYRRNAGPFLQAMFFFQSLGALISPLIIGSFMANGPVGFGGEWSNCSLPEELEAAVAKSLSNSDFISQQQQQLQLQQDASLEEAMSRVRYPFYTIAVIQIPIMLCMLYRCYKEGWNSEVTRDNESCNGDDEAADMREEGASAYLVLLFASACALALDGILGSYSTLIYTFSMRAVSTRSERSRTAYLSATFWGSTLLGRLIGIFLTLRLSTVHVLFLDLAGLFLGALLFMVGQHSVGMLFAATIITGFFISHCMPALLALTEQFIQVTRDRATSLVASAAFGEAVLPVLMAAVMHKIGRSAYPVFHTLFVMISAVLCFFLVNFGFRTKKSEYNDSSLSNFMLFGLLSKNQSAMSSTTTADQMPMQKFTIHQQRRQQQQHRSSDSQQEEEEDFFANNRVNQF